MLGLAVSNLVPGSLTKIVSKDALKPGDHIYSWRNVFYAHHGIYVGDGKVIHLTDPGSASSASSHNSGSRCPLCGYHSNLSGVISSCLDCFLQKGRIYVYQYAVNIVFFRLAPNGTCTLSHAGPAKDVLHRAFTCLEKGFGGYNAVSNNCETFAWYCKTGKTDNLPSNHWLMLLKPI